MVHDVVKISACGHIGVKLDARERMKEELSTPQLEPRTQEPLSPAHCSSRISTSRNSQKVRQVRLELTSKLEDGPISGSLQPVFACPLIPLRQGEDFGFQPLPFYGESVHKRPLGRRVSNSSRI